MLVSITIGISGKICMECAVVIYTWILGNMDSDDVLDRL